MWTEVNQRRLRAAREVGVLTFDLAAATDHSMNGLDGGKFLYDAVHYTLEGSREVARTLRPVLFEILTDTPLRQTVTE